MNTRTPMWIGLLALAALVMVGSVFFLRSHTVLAPTKTDSNIFQTGSTTTTVLGDGSALTTPSGTTVTIIPKNAGGVAAPSLTTPIIISATLSPEAQNILRTKEETLIAALKKDPTNGDLWLDLGIDRKIGGDYAGAALVWEYVAKTATPAYIAYGNLGGLYMDYLKDYPKAEINFKQAIALSPETIDYYRQLYTLYKYAYKTNTTAAADILAQGLKANPGNPDLLALQKQ